jgi:hypothetical protein
VVEIRPERGEALALGEEMLDDENAQRERQDDLEYAQKLVHVISWIYS